MAGLLGPAAAAVARGQEVVEEIVALVNDDIITLSELPGRCSSCRLAQLRAQAPSAEEYDKAAVEVKKGLLDFMITDLLLLQKAKELGLNVQEQIKGMIQNLMKENNICLRRRPAPGRRAAGLDLRGLAQGSTRKA